MAIGIHHPGGAVTFSCEVIPGAQWGQICFKVVFEFLLPCPSTGPKRFCACPNFLGSSKI